MSNYVCIYMYDNHNFFWCIVVKTIYKERVVDKKRCIDDWSWNGVRVSSKEFGVCVCPIFLQGEQRRLYTTWVKFFNIFNILCMYIDVFIMYIYFIIYKKYENRECHTSMWTCTLVRTTCITHSSTNSKYFINACMISYDTLFFNPIFTYVPFFHHPETHANIYIYIPNLPSSLTKTSPIISFIHHRCISKCRIGRFLFQLF